MNSKLLKAILLISLSLVMRPAQAADNGAVTFSVSPPLFKINMKAGEGWSSFVKVINNNAYPVTVYPEVANFKSNDNGGVEFLGVGSSDYLCKARG